MSQNQDIIINVYQKTFMKLYGDVITYLCLPRIAFYALFPYYKINALHSEILKYSGNLTFHFCLPNIINLLFYTVQTMNFVQYYVEFLQKEIHGRMNMMFFN